MKHIYSLLLGLSVLSPLSASAQDAADLQLLRPKTYSTLFQCGDLITVYGTIKNVDGATVTTPSLYYSLNNGAISGKFPIEVTLERGKSTPFAIQIPALLFEDTDVTIDLEVRNSNGTADTYPDDNFKQVTGLRVEEHPFIRKMVVEEGTGTWCGNCPRGIVGLETMKANYPERFIGIAVHNGDPMVVGAYDKWMTGNVDGLPGCLINRDGAAHDPSPTDLTKYMTQNAALKEAAEAEVTASATLTGGVLNAQAEVLFREAASGRKYYVVFVLVQDGLTGKQKNYYAGGGFGKMDGWEDLPAEVETTYKEVARGVWPVPEGNASLALPANVEAGTTYTASLDIATADVKKFDAENSRLVALLIDGDSKVILNAGECELTVAEGIGTVLAPISTAGSASYDLNGRQLTAPAKGISIVSGRKVIR